MKRLLNVSLVAILLATAAGCNCMNCFKKSSCAPPPAPVQANCYEGQMMQPVGGGAPVDMYGPVPQ
ncbi:MAG: hypothetical protein JNG90_19260 [Planctomycetaceae bacterium]|nr:hypothetical protein [Planctomycetaceae bacterium]